MNLSQIVTIIYISIPSVLAAIFLAISLKNRKATLVGFLGFAAATGLIYAAHTLIYNIWDIDLLWHKESAYVIMTVLMVLFNAQFLMTGKSVVAKALFRKMIPALIIVVGVATFLPKELIILLASAFVPTVIATLLMNTVNVMKFGKKSSSASKTESSNTVKLSGSKSKRKHDKK